MHACNERGAPASWRAAAVRPGAVLEGVLEGVLWCCLQRQALQAQASSQVHCRQASDLVGSSYEHIVQHQPVAICLPRWQCTELHWSATCSSATCSSAAGAQHCNFTIAAARQQAAGSLLPCHLRQAVPARAMRWLDEVRLAPVIGYLTGWLLASGGG
jgi:hypothetical protein